MSRSSTSCRESIGGLSGFQSAVRSWRSPALRHSVENEFVSRKAQVDENNPRLAPCGSLDAEINTNGGEPMSSVFRGGSGLAHGHEEALIGQRRSGLLIIGRFSEQSNSNFFFSGIHHDVVLVSPLDAFQCFSQGIR